MTWWKPRPAKSRDIPVYVPVERRPVAPEHASETTEQALRHVRTHIAAQAGEISNLNVKVGLLSAQLDRAAELLDQVHAVTVRAER